MDLIFCLNSLPAIRGKAVHASKDFTINVRIPGWAENKENPFDLYMSKASGPITLKINGTANAVHSENGYVALKRKWKKGDIIELSLPVGPRLVTANDSVQSIKGKVAIASGPVVFSLESIDNPGLKDYTIKTGTPLTLNYKKDLLGGINVISGTAVDSSGKKKRFTAIPFYSVGNRKPGASYQVWFPN